MANTWDVVGDIASVAQLSGLDALGVGEGAKQVVESVGTLQRLVDELSMLVASGRFVRQDLSGLDILNVHMCLPTLDTMLDEAQSKLPEARRTCALGADQMRKELVTSKDKINDVLKIVDAAVNRETLKVSSESNSEIKEVRRMIEGLQAALQQIRSAIEASHIALEHQLHSPESFLNKLRELAQRDHQHIVQGVEIAPHGSVNWKPAFGSASGNAQAERGSLVGDYELPNNYKIRDTLKSDEISYFHVLTRDCLDPSLKVIFPDTAKKKNELRSRCTRKFPNKTTYGDDINTWVLTKTLPRRQVQECSAYFIFTNERLGTGDELLTTAHMEKMLTGDSVIVEVLKFLVK